MNFIDARGQRTRQAIPPPPKHGHLEFGVEKRAKGPGWIIIGSAEHDGTVIETSMRSIAYIAAAAIVHGVPCPCVSDPATPEFPLAAGLTYLKASQQAFASKGNPSRRKPSAPKTKAQLLAAIRATANQAQARAAA